MQGPSENRDNKNFRKIKNKVYCFLGCNKFLDAIRICRELSNCAQFKEILFLY
jgi:hypothetical protein